MSAKSGRPASANRLHLDVLRGGGAEAELVRKLTSDEFTQPMSLHQRIEAGKALRDRVPRAQHGKWTPSESRADPIDILLAADAERIPELVPIRYGRMLESPFAFYRGSAGIMAADLSATPNTGLIVQLAATAT